MVSVALSPGRIEKLLTQSIKRTLTESGLKTSTRSGNKELTLLVKKVALAPFGTEAEVQTVGAALGKKIVALSQQSSRQNLEGGVIRQLAFKKDWAREFSIPIVPPTERVSKKTAKSSQTIVSVIKATPLEKMAQMPPSTAELTAAEPLSSATAELTTQAESDPKENMSADNDAANGDDDIVQQTEDTADSDIADSAVDKTIADSAVADKTTAKTTAENIEEETMPNQTPENVEDAVIAPEAAAMPAKSAEAEALSPDADANESSSPAEPASPKELDAAIEAAESEVLEKISREEA